MFARARLSCQIRAAALLDRFCDGLRPSVSGHRSLHLLLFDCRNYTPCTVITLQKNPSAGWINFGFVSALQHSTVLSRLWPKRSMEKRSLRSRYLFVRAAPGSHFSMFALKGAFALSICAHPVSSRCVCTQPGSHSVLRLSFAVPRLRPAMPDLRYVRFAPAFAARLVFDLVDLRFARLSAMPGGISSH